MQSMYFFLFSLLKPNPTPCRFAVVVCPVYEDPDDQQDSQMQNSTPFGWSWLSTVNRVNSQVMKVLFVFLFLIFWGKC
jgi:hypothetical protein